MHTIMVVLGGFLLLGVCLLAGRLAAKPMRFSSRA